MTFRPDVRTRCRPKKTRLLKKTLKQTEKAEDSFVNITHKCNCFSEATKTCPLESKVLS